LLDDADANERIMARRALIQRVQSRRCRRLCGF
jgi:hypothetical protein